MRIGCFALVEPFCPMKRQFEAIAEMGIRYADLTDNHDGGMLGVEYGFAASVSLDSHPARIQETAEAAGVTLTSFCAHANLLDPPSPDVYGTNQIIKAIRLANLLGIRHVITTEGDPKTDFGHGLTTEVVARQDGGQCLRQEIHRPGIDWAAMRYASTVVGDPTGDDVTVQVEAALETHADTAAIRGTLYGCATVKGKCLMNRHGANA